MSRTVDPRPRVLLVESFSGGNAHGVLLARALALSTRLTVLTVADTRIEPADCERLLPVLPPFGAGGGRLAKLARELWGALRLALELWRHRKDSVHVQSFRSTAIEAPLYFLLRPWLRRLVITAHNALPHETRGWHRSFYARWYRLVDRIHVLSTYARDRLLADFGVPGDKLLLTPHGNYEGFVSEHPANAGPACRATFEIPQEARVVLFFGVIRPYKGVDRLLAAFELLAKAEDLHLVIAGSATPALAHELEAAIARNEARARIHLRARFSSDPELAALLRMADVVVFPYEHIYQSGALMLAMSYGKAIIASDIPGLAEYIDDGVEGVLCDTSKSTHLAREILALAREDARREALGAAAREASLEFFAWEGIASQIEAMYR
jgi:glycosyltransferase involved in cell wall biosynthesis